MKRKDIFSYLIREMDDNSKSELDGELKELLEFCKEEPIFFGEGKRLLSISEIINSKAEMNLEKDIIPIIDLQDNDFVGYDIQNKKFVKYYIVDEEPWENLESIQIYINMLKEINK